MVGSAANIEIATDGITVDICGDTFRVSLDKLDEISMRHFGTFMLAAWRDHEQRELGRKFNMVKELLEFEGKE